MTKKEKEFNDKLSRVEILYLQYGNIVLIYQCLSTFLDFLESEKGLKVFKKYVLESLKLKVKTLIAIIDKDFNVSKDLEYINSLTANKNK